MRTLSGVAMGLALLLVAAYLAVGTESLIGISGGCSGDQCVANGCNEYEDNCPGPEAGCSSRTYITSTDNLNYSCGGDLGVDECWPFWNDKQPCVKTYSCMWDEGACVPSGSLIGQTMEEANCKPGTAPIWWFK
jgi:hypothetical protein